MEAIPIKEKQLTCSHSSLHSSRWRKSNW